MRNFKIKIIIFIIIFFCQFQEVIAKENKIIFKIDNEIITSVDINKELKFLTALNPNILKLDKSEIFKITNDSIIREKIKEAEILKKFDKLDIDNAYINKLIKQNYTRLGISNENEFINYLNKYEVSYNDIKRKLSIDLMWNNLIYSMFINKIKINENEIRDQVIKDSKKKLKTYNISEIIFNLNENEDLETKYTIINNKIQINGFDNAALSFSISDTKNIGGELGWVKENVLNSRIKNELENLNTGEHTAPIIVPGGFLIIKLNEKKIITEDENKNLDDEVKNIINIKINNLLNQYSNIYYNKIKKNTSIEKI